MGLTRRSAQWTSLRRARASPSARYRPGRAWRSSRRQRHETATRAGPSGAVREIARAIHGHDECRHRLWPETLEHRAILVQPTLVGDQRRRLALRMDAA